MSKVVPEPYYKCDICGGDKGNNHFKIKVPGRKIKFLKLWKKIDMCNRCHMKFYTACKFDKED